MNAVLSPSTVLRVGQRAVAIPASPFAGPSKSKSGRLGKTTTAGGRLLRRGRHLSLMEP